jgi:hypothetical protein
MRLSFDGAVRSLAVGMAARAISPNSEQSSDEEVAAFLLAIHARMPDHLRLAIRCATLALDAWPLATSKRPFHRLPPIMRNAQIARWERSRLGPIRSVMTFYRRLATYAVWAAHYEEHRETVDAG